MKALVTGAAGFLGSTLVDELLAQGWSVRGVDCFTPFYDEGLKREHLAHASRHPAFELIEADLRVRDCSALTSDVDVVFHLASHEGVRDSWSNGFALHSEHNTLATQRVLEGALATGARVVYTSTSSVYGNNASYPTSEQELPRPHSPYAATKLAAEHLCELYASNFGLHTVVLRLFTAIGPRQRPDMALHRLIHAAVSGERFPLYGAGTRVRDFTSANDMVHAIITAATAAVDPGTVINIGGGGSTSMDELIALVEQATQQPVRIEHAPAQPGNVDTMGPSTELALSILGWKPSTPLENAVEQQARWQVDRWRRSH